MIYMLYKTTNLKNGRYYIGVHKTENESDGYLGSGKLLLRAIDKHGKDSFKRETLALFDNEEAMYAKEAEVVTEEIVSDRLSYNVKLGGSSNFYYVNKHGLNHKVGQHLIHSSKLKANTEYRAAFIEKMKDASSFNVYQPDPVSRAKNAKAGWGKMTPERRSELARKRWEKRRGSG